MEGLNIPLLASPSMKFMHHLYTQVVTLYQPLFVLCLFLCFSVIFGHLQTEEQVLVSSVENGA
jgi:hypothetical protein